MGAGDTVTVPRGLVATLGTWGRMVKLSHSVFALPFAFAGAALAAARYGFAWRQLPWIAIAMVAARNAAMGFNRLLDQDIDALNPRTASRELPRGELSRRAVWVMTAALGVIFVVASFQLNRLCGLLSPLALAIVLGYSATKRFTWASHLVLGLSLSIAPVGGWLAIAGRFEATPWLLACAVVFWVAGFDTIYACQDVAFDRIQGLYSIPARFGVPRALAIARGFHAAAILAMAGVGFVAGLGRVYGAGVLLIAAVLVWEHRLVRADDLGRVGVAFLNANALVSVLYFGVVLAALAIDGPAR